MQPFFSSRSIIDSKLAVIQKIDALCRIHDISSLRIGFSFHIKQAPWTPLLALGQLRHIENMSLYGEQLSIHLLAADWRLLL